METLSITKDNDISIQIVSKEKTIELPVSIIKVSRHGLLANLIFYNQKAVSFDNNDNIKYNLICSVDNEGKPYIWKNISVSNTKINNKQYILLKTYGKGTPYNRRAAYRLPLDIKCKLLGVGDAILHDISNCGVSFYLPKDNIFSNKEIALNFENRYEQYAIKAQVVRKEEDSNNNRILYGCKMNPSPMIDNLLTEEQRYRIKRK